MVSKRSKTKTPKAHTKSSSHGLISRPSKLKKWHLLSFGAIIGLFGVWALINSLAAGTANLYVTPASSAPSLGSNFTVTIKENSGTDAINAVQADLTYDQTKLQYVSMDTSTSAFDLAGPSSGGSGSVKIARAKSSTTLTGDQIVATVTFKAIGVGSSSVAFASSSALVLASNNTNVLVSTTPGNYTVTDTTPPSVPTGLTAGTRTVNSIAFSWTASTDNVGVAGYRVYRNGTLINNNVSGTTFTNTGLSPNTSYTYTVLAFDAVGNTSAQSSGLVTSTLPDTTPPSVPTGLTAGTRTVNSIAFSWTASTDNVGVAGYNIFQNGTKIATSASTSYTATGLAPGTNYQFTVSAYDAVPNTSAVSTALSTSTLADTSPPSVPTGLNSPTRTVNSISLAWTSSTDNVAVVGYNIFRNGIKVGTSTTTTYTDSGLTQGTTYSYTVSAYDAVPNTSAVSTSVSFATVTKPGDVNSDGIVNILDLSILANNYSLSGKTLADGDLTGDGIVNIFDLSVLATNWGL